MNKQKLEVRINKLREIICQLALRDIEHDEFMKNVLNSLYKYHNELEIEYKKL